MKFFKNSEFSTIRIVCDECGNPWFCGKDVAEALGCINTAKSIRDHVNAKDKLTERIVQSGLHPRTAPPGDGLTQSGGGVRTNS